MDQLPTSSIIYQKVDQARPYPLSDGIDDLPSAGEDELIHCPICLYTANSELAISLPADSSTCVDAHDCIAYLLDVPSTRTLVVVLLPEDKALNLVKIRQLHTDARFVSATQPLSNCKSLQVLVDETCKSLDAESIQAVLDKRLAGNPLHTSRAIIPLYNIGDFRIAKAGEICPKCSGTLRSSASIELGHTFLLGTKYSKSLDATFARINDPQQTRQPYQMGCYGIGITRLIGAIAEICCDERGLYWPPSVAPYRLCIVALEPDSWEELLPSLVSFLHDIVVDDRHDQTYGKRMTDAEIIGYPCVIVLGKRWRERKEIELYDRKTGQNTVVPAEHVQHAINSILSDSL